MAQAGAFVTGDKELDAILATMEDKEIKEAVRKATRATIKNHVLPGYRQRIIAAGFVDTEAMLDVAKPKAVARSRTQYGTELYIDREKVVALREERGGKIGYDTKRGEKFFHPVAIEFGVESVEPQRPLWHALNGNIPQALAEFRIYMRIAVAQIGRRAVLRARRALNEALTR